MFYTCTYSASSDAGCGDGRGKEKREEEKGAWNEASLRADERRMVQIWSAS